MGTFFNETYRESEWAFPFASLLFFKGSVWEWGSFSNQKKKNVTVSLTHLIPCDRCRMEGNRKMHGERGAEFSPFSFPLIFSSFHFSSRFTWDRKQRVCGNGEVFQIRKRGCIFHTHPCPCAREGKGNIQAWGIFSNERYREREGRVSLPSLSPI